MFGHKKSKRRRRNKKGNIIVRAYRAVRRAVTPKKKPLYKRIFRIG
jgi:hypothetical protein